MVGFGQFFKIGKLGGFEESEEKGVYVGVNGPPPAVFGRGTGGVKCLGVLAHICLGILAVLTSPVYPVGERLSLGQSLSLGEESGGSGILGMKYQRA